MSIEVNSLSKNYGTQKAVNNISFTVGSGEIVGFLGPNGAGKSTTMKMITGFLEADSGDIKVCGLTAGSNNLEAKRKIGYLPEANPLYLDMYVREYLSFIAGVHQLTNSRQLINEAIEKVGLQVESHKKIGQLSKGYKQRVGLAAAILHNPEVLILDEPTSGLDPNQIVEIRQLIKDLAREKTILFSSHIMQEVEAICSRVLIIHKGNIVADESLQNLKENNSNRQDVKVSFTEIADAELLKKLPTVINLIGEVNGRNFIISSTDAALLKKEILQFSVAHNLNIESLQSSGSSLEEIFKTYTQ